MIIFANISHWFKYETGNPITCFFTELNTFKSYLKTFEILLNFNIKLILSISRIVIIQEQRWYNICHLGLLIQHFRQLKMD